MLYNITHSKHGYHIVLINHERYLRSWYDPRGHDGDNNGNNIEIYYGTLETPQKFRAQGSFTIADTQGHEKNIELNDRMRFLVEQFNKHHSQGQQGPSRKVTHRDLDTNNEQHGQWSLYDSRAELKVCVDADDDDADDDDADDNEQ